MEKEHLIAADEFCVHHHIGISFISSLHEFGLIEIIQIDESIFIPINQLPKLEKMLRLHGDLNINLEGIDAITHLLDQIADLKNQINDVRNKLRLYGDGEA